MQVVTIEISGTFYDSFLKKAIFSNLENSVETQTSLIAKKLSHKTHASVDLLCIRRFPMT